jgi:DNA-binding MarR family transcriptional regulator
MAVADRLHSAAIHLLRRLRRVDDESGLSAARLSALSVLVFGGPRTIGALAEAEQVAPPTMTKLVQGMEKDGLVRRGRDAADRRSVMIRATVKGGRVLRAGRRRRVEYLAALLRSLDRANLGQLGQAAGLMEQLARQANSDTRRSIAT